MSAELYLAYVAACFAIFMAVATLCDGVYAVLVGKLGLALSGRRVRLASRLSGGLLIGGGIWLALARAR